MVKRLIAILCFLLPMAAVSQKKKLFSFKVNGTVINHRGGTLYMHHIENEKEVSDSVKVVDGKFNFTSKCDEPMLYWFNFSPYPNVQPAVMFFSDPGTVNATLYADSLMSSSIKGGVSQSDYTDYRKMINSFVALQMRMQAGYTEAMQKNDQAAMDNIRNDFQNLNGQFIGGMVDFVKTHPRSYVSGYVVSNDMNNPAIPFEKVVEAHGYIDRSMKETRYVQSATKRIDGLKGTMIGFAANDFSQNTPEGKAVKLSDYRGKYVLVDFWASWCGPCRMENPNVVMAFNKYKEKGFTVLGVSFDNSKDKWLEAIKKDNLTWEHVSDLKGWGNEVGKMYSITSIPQNLLIDKEGKIVAKNLRGPALEEKLAEIIK